MRHRLPPVPLLLILISAGLAGGPALAASAPPNVRAGAADRRDLALTLYQQDLGLVQETREVALAPGVQTVEFGDVSERIDPAAVLLHLAGDAEGARLLEQRYEYDVLGYAAILERYVGRRLQLVTHDDQGEHFTEATLIAGGEEPIYRIGDRTWLGHPGRVVLPELPEGLRDRPTLVWLLDAGKGGRARLEASYLTGGIGWSADYVVRVDRAEATADVAGWATIRNDSGAAYPDARLKLVAGEVRREAPSPKFETMRVMAAAEAAPSFAQEELGEYHLYALDRKATLENRRTVQLALLSASGAAVKKRLVFAGTPQWFHAPMGEAGKGLKPDVVLEIENRAANRLGLALPAGRVRVYQADASGAPQFVGEQTIGHTPQDATLRLQVGRAFDVEADRVQTDFRAVASGRYDQEVAFRIDVRNARTEAATVTLREPIPGDWKLLESSPAGRKADAHTLEFELAVPPGGAAVVSYRVAVDVR